MGSALHINTGTSTSFPAGTGSMNLSEDATIGVSAGSTFTVAQKINGGGRSLTKAGTGTLILESAENGYGSTIVADGTFTLAPVGELRFVLLDGGLSERVLGSGAVDLAGLLRVDPSRVSDANGTWNLVDVANLDETWGETFALSFLNEEAEPFIDEGGGIFTSGNWTFRQATGDLTLGPETVGTVWLAAELAGDQIQLSWPAEAVEYILETTPDLSMPGWQAVEGTPEEQDGLFRLLVPMDEPRAFYRLHSP